MLHNGTLQNGTLHNGTAFYKIVQSNKIVHVTQRYSYNTLQYKTVHRHYGLVHNSTLQSQSTDLHQPLDLCDW
jgi:hypothetical protein